MRRLVLPLSILSWLGVWAALKFGVQPPIPGQVMGLYMAITSVAILVYLVADQARFTAFLAPLVTLLREKQLAVPRILSLIALPLLLGWFTYTGVPMPPMGANPALSDADLLAIVEFIRSLRN